MQKSVQRQVAEPMLNVPFGVTYEKIGTIQRRLAWPLHKDDTLSRSGRPTGLNIYCFLNLCFFFLSVDLLWFGCFMYQAPGLSGESISLSLLCVSRRNNEMDTKPHA